MSIGMQLTYSHILDDSITVYNLAQFPACSVKY